MKYSVNFILDKSKTRPDEANVRMVVQWTDGRVTMMVGHRVVIDKWSKEAQRCRANTTHGVYSSTYINKTIQKYEDAANAVMQTIESPTSESVKNGILTNLGLISKADAKKEERSVKQDMYSWLIEQSSARSWTDSTVISINTFISYVNAAIPNLTYDFFKDGEEGISAFADIMTSQGKRSSTIKVYVQKLRWFLKWAQKKGYVASVPDDDVAVKSIKKKIIFLTSEELLSLYNMPLVSPADMRYRDFFCFCCFTGLRYSDAHNLKMANIVDGKIVLTSQKDTDNLVIELNKYARGILERVALTDKEKEDGYALPHLFPSQVNLKIKDLAKACGIDSPVTISYIAGGKRIEETKPKYKLISSHTGRKTFICTALSKGVSPNIVMKWTGHSSYEAMLPYIDIADSAKQEAMSVFDTL